MLDYNEVKEKKYIVLTNEPFEVISSSVSRQQQRKPVNKTKLKSLISGRVIEYTFQSFHERTLSLFIHKETNIGSMLRETNLPDLRSI
jgi:translation elongation factor P/translation initiation factor 5A